MSYVVLPMAFRTVQHFASCRWSKGEIVFVIKSAATGVVAPTIVRLCVAVVKRVLLADLWLITLFFTPMPRPEVTDPR